MNTKYKTKHIKTMMRLKKQEVPFAEIAKITGIPAGSITSMDRRAKAAGIRVRRLRTVKAPDLFETQPESVIQATAQTAQHHPADPVMTFEWTQTKPAFEDAVLEILTLKHCDQKQKARMIGMICGN
jgi:hypothetical protein